MRHVTLVRCAQRSIFVSKQPLLIQLPRISAAFAVDRDKLHRSYLRVNLKRQFVPSLSPMQYISRSVNRTNRRQNGKQQTLKVSGEV